MIKVLLQIQKEKIDLINYVIKLSNPLGKISKIIYFKIYSRVNFSRLKI